MGNVNSSWDEARQREWFSKLGAVASLKAGQGFTKVKFRDVKVAAGLVAESKKRKKDREEAGRQKAALGRDGGVEEPNWDCDKCLNSNFPSRSECNRCSAPKPSNGFKKGRWR